MISTLVTLGLLPVLDGDGPLALDGGPAVLGDDAAVSLAHDQGGDAADAKVLLQGLQKERKRDILIGTVEGSQVNF